MKDNPVEFKRATEAVRLLKAADVIQRRGWTDDSYGSTRKLCILQALAVADGRGKHAWNEWVPEALIAAARTKLPANRREHLDQRDDGLSDYQTIFVWEYNDHYCDGKEAAIQLLKNAAAATLKG